MSEVRARAARHKGQLNFEAELRTFLWAFGDDKNPLPETVRVLDEIVTDFIIEACHEAARSAGYSNRQKIKVDDFKFAIRNDEVMLGRVQELLGMAKVMSEARKQMDDALVEGKAGLERARPTKEGRTRRKRAVAGDGLEEDE